jgi:hypothetical protein
MELKITEYDRCPACKKKTLILSKERGGVLRATCGAVVCKCGCHYMPQSLIDMCIKQAESPIIHPDQIVDAGQLKIK